MGSLKLKFLVPLSIFLPNQIRCDLKSTCEVENDSYVFWAAILTTNPKLWRPFITFKKGPFRISHKSPDWKVDSFSKPYCIHPLLKFSIFVIATKGDITFF